MTLTAVLLLALAQTPGSKPAPAPAPPPAVVAPRLVGPESVPAYKLVRLKVDGDADSGVFFIEPFEDVDVFELPDGKSAVFTGPPGRYVVQSVTIRAGKLSKDRLVVTIGEAPPPTPGPTPNPGPTPPNPTPPNPTPTPDPPPPAPDPAPVASGRLYLSYVVDPNIATSAAAAIRTSPAIRKALASLDASWRTYSADEEDVARLRLDKHFPNAGVLPALIVQDAAGKVLESIAAPDEAGVIAAARKWRGTK